MFQNSFCSLFWRSFQFTPSVLSDTYLIILLIIQKLKDWIIFHVSSFQNVPKTSNYIKYFNKTSFFKNYVYFFSQEFQNLPLSKLFLTELFSFLILVQRIRANPDKRGLKLNVLTQNGFIYNRMKDVSDRIFWKCALSTTHKCNAIFATNKVLRVIDSQKNQHTHDKAAYESLKSRMKLTRKCWKKASIIFWILIKVENLNHKNFNQKVEKIWESLQNFKIFSSYFFSTAEHVSIDYYETPRGAKGILCHGYYFVKEKAFGKTINWWVHLKVHPTNPHLTPPIFRHCMHKKKYGCGARGITNFSDPMVMRITKKIHTHSPEEKNYSILPIAALFK